MWGCPHTEPWALVGSCLGTPTAAAASKISTSWRVGWASRASPSSAHQPALASKMGLQENIGGDVSSLLAAVAVAVAIQCVEDVGSMGAP